MSVDMQAIRERFSEQGTIFDLETIRYRVMRGDVVFSQRVLLTALIKYNHDQRENLIQQLGRDYFGNFDRLFDWIVLAPEDENGVDVDYLYEKTWSHIRTQTIPEYITFVDQILAIDMPEPEALADAVTYLQQLRLGMAKVRQESTDVERLVIVALIKGEQKTQQRILDRLSTEHFQHLVFSAMFEWTADLLKCKDKVEKEDLHDQATKYVLDRISPGFTSLIDHLLMIDVPDIQIVENALAVVKKRYDKD